MLASTVTPYSGFPGQPVALGLTFEPAQIAVSVVNPLPPAGGQGPRARHRTGRPGRGRPDAA